MTKRVKPEIKPQVNMGLIIALGILLLVGIASALIRTAAPKDPTLTSAPTLPAPQPGQVNSASPELLEAKRRLAGEPPGGAPPKPAQPYKP